MASKKFHINPEDERPKKFNIYKDHLDQMKGEEEGHIFSGGFNVLDEIFAKVDSRSPPLISGAVQKVVRFNKKKGKVIRSGSIFLQRDKQEDYYLITNNKQVATPRISFNFKYREYGSIWLLGEFKLKTVEGLEETLVEQIANKGSMQVAVYEFLDQWIEEILNTQSLDMVINFRTFLGILAREINRKAFVLGLEIQSHFQLRNINNTEQIAVASQNFFSVQPKLFAGHVQIKFKALLQVKNDELGLAALFYDKKNRLEGLLSGEVKNIIRSHFTYNNLVFNLRGTVREQMIEFFNDFLSKQRTGRRIIELELETNEELPPPFIMEKFPIVVPIRNNVEFNLINTVTLDLEDPALFKTKGINDLRIWIADELKRIAILKLAEAEFADLIGRLGQYELRIKQELQTRTRLIGYRVQYFLAAPDGDIPDKIDLELNTDQQEFPTYVDGVIVKLNVILSGRIKDFDAENLRKYITPDTNIEEEIRRVVYRTTRRFLHRIDPNDFYTDFEEKIVDKLTKELKETLEEEFNLDQRMDILLKRLETDLISLLKNLQQGRHSVQIESKDGVLIFEAWFNVLGIWAESLSVFKDLNFQSKEEGINNIRTILKSCVEPSLDLVSGELLNLNDPRLSAKVLELLNNSLSLIKNELGLDVAISKGLRRLPNKEEIFGNLDKTKWLEGESKILDKRIDAQTDRYSNQVKRLIELEQEIQLATAGEDAELAEKLQIEKEELEEKVFRKHDSKNYGERRSLSDGEDAVRQFLGAGESWQEESLEEQDQEVDENDEDDER